MGFPFGSSPAPPPAAPELSFLFSTIALAFACAHSATGLAALLFETDLFGGVLSDTAKFKVLKELAPGSMAAFLRGPKANGRATAPNVRGWGGRQFAIGAVFFFAYFSGELVAFQAALIALCARACSDVVQNLIDGCYWKCFLFGSVELMIAYICSSAF